MSGPARGYSWEPFKPGNFAGVRHGARSPRIVSPIAEELTEEIRKAAPWLKRDAFAPAVQSLAWVQAQLYLLRGFVDEHGPLTEDGEVRHVMHLMGQLERQGARLMAECGMTPASQANLLSTLAGVLGQAGGDALKALREEGARIVTEHRRQLTASDDEEES
jgi:hypothetical protein